MGNQKTTKLLLTGAPGCGKTTLIGKLAKTLESKRLAGFITEEIREDGRRTGFQARTLAGEEALLSSIHHNSWVSVGKYGVDVRSFESLVLPELEKPPKEVDLFLIDEIGKMECFCPGFVKAVNKLLASEVSLVATVSLDGKGLIRDVKARDDVEIITVTPGNRENLTETLATKVVH